MKKIIIGNWKMNLGWRASLALASSIKTIKSGHELVVCPSFFALAETKKILAGSQIKLGAQDASVAEPGAHTGEVSAKSLREIGCAYLILGHSERRAQGESCRVINLKIKAALKAGLLPILCVGEPWAKRQNKQSAAFVAGQLKRALVGVKTKNLLIAYEPIWAIGTGRALGVTDAVMMHGFIRQTAQRLLGVGAKISVLYGGSVDAKNAPGFLKAEEIDGLLIGGASLKPQEFKKIANIK